ncbi:MAG: protein kinase, partial [bacterium]
MPTGAEADPPGLDATIVQSSEAVAAAKAQAAPSELPAAEAPKVPGYVLLAPLGRGAFAEVWKARQQRTGKLVALKVFHQRQGVNWVMLQRELERLTRLDKHPHVVSLLDADLTGDTAWYATELLEKGSLEKFVTGKGTGEGGERERADREPRLRRGEAAVAATPDRVAQWMEEIAEALAFVHGKGII